MFLRFAILLAYAFQHFTACYLSGFPAPTRDFSCLIFFYAKYLYKNMPNNDITICYIYYLVAFLPELQSAICTSGTTKTIIGSSVTNACNRRYWGCPLPPHPILDSVGYRQLSFRWADRFFVAAMFSALSRNSKYHWSYFV